MGNFSLGIESRLSPDGDHRLAPRGLHPQSALWGSKMEIPYRLQQAQLGDIEDDRRSTYAFCCVQRALTP